MEGKKGRVDVRWRGGRGGEMGSGRRGEVKGGKQFPPWYIKMFARY